MEWDTFLPLISFAVATLWTPGPNNIMLANSGATFGFRRTGPHLLGVALGAAFMFFLVAIGLGEVFQASPTFRTVLRWAGAVVLIYLAWRIATAGRAKAHGRGRPFTFLEAAAFQWVNPKAWSMAIGVASTYVTGTDPVREAAFCAGIFAAIGLTSASGWTAFGAALRRYLADDRRLRIFNIAMGLLIVLSVAALMIEG